MKQVLIGRGGVVVAEVPCPAVRAGCVLIAVEYSALSVGTESIGVRQMSKPVWRRVLEKPTELQKAATAVRRDGLRRTRALVRSRLETVNPIGYSAAGRVIEVGAGVNGVQVGDRVACAGSEWAHHAEVVCVPKNLVVSVPDAVDTRSASLVTLGAIALQGVRRAAPTLGEVFAVIGLGLLGQLTQQMLQAHGARVIGLDLDRRRVELAKANGMEHGIVPGNVDAVGQCLRISGGAGVDGVIVCAASASNDILAQAFAMCRRKARVVVVGDVGLGINRADIYRKELDFLISTSYGPGRYDAAYEEGGLDYPIGYVRWTEHRNLSEVLRLMGQGKLSTANLLEADFSLDDAPGAYGAITRRDAAAPLAVTLSYPRAVQERRERVVQIAPRRGSGGRLALGVIGAGGFAQSMLLPIVEEMADTVEIACIATRQSHTAMALAKRWGAGIATTDYRALLNDRQVHAVLIATRHDRHGTMVLEALQAGKAVFVEKPLCLTADECSRIEDFFANTADPPVLMTGFNRRFSPYAGLIAETLASRTNPMMVNYRVNAGWIDPENWVHGPEGGGRNLGEACHFYDFFTFLTDARVRDVRAHAIRPSTAHYRRNDNFVATMGFADGSICTLTYTALGAREHPKERIEIYCDGTVIDLEDFTKLKITGGQARTVQLARADKGHKGGLSAFIDAVRSGTPPHLPVWQQIQATRIALDIEVQIGKQ